MVLYQNGHFGDPVMSNVVQDLDLKLDDVIILLLDAMDLRVLKILWKLKHVKQLLNAQVSILNDINTKILRFIQSSLACVNVLLYCFMFPHCDGTNNLRQLV